MCRTDRLHGSRGADTFETAQKFCEKMCTDPIFPEFPVYGSNNWYYAYGDSSEEEILSDTDYILKLTEGVKNSPFMVIDDCWQEHHRLDEYNGGPWTKGNARFPDMKGLADKLEKKGVRPGIWVRLLLNEDENIPMSGEFPIMTVSIRPTRMHWHISIKISRGSVIGDTR